MWNIPISQEITVKGKEYYIYDNYNNTFVEYSLCNRHYKNLQILSFTLHNNPNKVDFKEVT